MINITTLLNYLKYINPFKQYNENKLDEKQNTHYQKLYTEWQKQQNIKQKQPIKHLQQKIIVRDKTNLCQDQIFKNEEEALKYIQHITQCNPDARPVLISTQTNTTN
jgi:uncharacterized membrane-anchored protein